MGLFLSNSSRATKVKSLISIEFINVEGNRKISTSDERKKPHKSMTYKSYFY